MHSQSIDRMIGELPTPLTQTSAPQKIRGLCQEFIDEIKEKTEPHPEDVGRHSTFLRLNFPKLILYSMSAWIRSRSTRW